MPVPDGLVLIGPHPGQGALLMHCIDPSVTTEGDALSVDPSLDPLNPANGYRGKSGTQYSREFIERYRAAQHDRVARIDVLAHSLIAARMAARSRVKAMGESALPEDRRIAAHTPILNVWRTDGDLRCFDLSLDPSDRKFGSLWGSDPFASNYGAVGFARQCTPESWLSTWSGLSSNATLAKTAAALRSRCWWSNIPVTRPAFPARPPDRRVARDDRQAAPPRPRRPPRPGPHARRRAGALRSGPPPCRLAARHLSRLIFAPVSGPRRGRPPPSS